MESNHIGSFDTTIISSKLPLLSITKKHSINIRTVGSYRLLSTQPNQIKLVYWSFGQGKMHSKLDFCPRPARKETNVPQHKLTVLIPIYNVSSVLQFEINLLKKKQQDCICLLSRGRSPRERRQAFSLLCQQETGVHKLSLLALAVSQTTAK